VDIKGLFKKMSGKLPGKALKKRLSKKIIIFSIAGLILIVLIAAALIFFLKSDGDGNSNGKSVEVENNQVNQVDYDNIVVLKSFVWIALKEKSHMGKISMNISLELVSKDQVPLVESKRENIRSFVRNLAMEMRWIELRTPEGKLKLKYTLINKINSLFPDVVVRNLYLTHFIMR